MSGLFAWAADVVGGGGASDDDDDAGERQAVPVVFTPEQERLALELDLAAASLRRSIHDLRLRIPPADIAQRLPHLHAHSLASNAALALQLNAHSATREQAQQRDITLQEENSAYEKAISTCQQKIQEKKQEADLLLRKLKDMDIIELQLKHELEKAQEAEASRSETSTTASNSIGNSNGIQPKDLEEKKKELILLEETIQRLEKEWTLVQQESAKEPSPAQREKLLENQLHSLIEQLIAKQAQAERLVAEIRAYEKDLERLNNLRGTPGGGISEVTVARNRFGRSFTISGGSEDYDADRRPPHRPGTSTESQQKLMLLRSACVLYILALHIIVFVRISF